MSIFNDKALKGVAEAVSKIVDEELKGNQHKIDANKNGKVDAHDFKLLRAKKGMKEELKQVDEAFPTVADAKKRMAAGKTWKEAISEEYRSNPNIEKFTELDALAKSYINAVSMIGTDKIPLPGKSATDEQWNEVYNKLGRPEFAQ